jgi:hypothetical protein
VSGERDELRRLVEELPDEQLPAVLSEVRRRLQPVENPVEVAWPPSWFGAISSGGSDLGRNHEHVLAEGFGRD